MHWLDVSKANLPFPWTQSPPCSKMAQFLFFEHSLKIFHSQCLNHRKGVFFSSSFSPQILILGPVRVSPPSISGAKLHCGFPISSCVALKDSISHFLVLLSSLLLYLTLPNTFISVSDKRIDESLPAGVERNEWYIYELLLAEVFRDLYLNLYLYLYTHN